MGGDRHLWNVPLSVTTSDSFLRVYQFCLPSVCFPCDRAFSGDLHPQLGTRPGQHIHQTHLLHSLLEYLQTIPLAEDRYHHRWNHCGWSLHRFHTHSGDRCSPSIWAKPARSFKHRLQNLPENRTLNGDLRCSLERIHTSPSDRRDSTAAAASKEEVRPYLGFHDRFWAGFPHYTWERISWLISPSYRVCVCSALSLRYRILLHNSTDITYTAMPLLISM